MRVKAILKSLFLAYTLSGICLMLLALVMFCFDPGQMSIETGIVLTYVLSCFAGGFLAGKILKKDRYLWGILTGFFYFLLLLTVSFAAEGHWDMSLQHFLGTFVMCLGGGALGGMLS